MANRYFLNIGANFGDTANWSDTSGGTGGFSVPTNVDDVFFDANSGNCTVNASARTAKTLNFTGYTNTITMTFGITVSGNVTLSATMTIAGASGLTVNATGNLTSNGKTWPNPLTLSGTSQTYTLIDDWTISGLITFSSGTAVTVNGFKIFTSGGVTTAAAGVMGGTTILEFTGGTLSSPNATLRFNTRIVGNLTITGTVSYSNATITYISGTVTLTGNTMSFGGTMTLNTSGMNWNNLVFSSSTITLGENLNINGLLTAVSGATINGSFNININGGISLGNIMNKGTGTPVLNLLGGTWSTTGANGYIYLNTNINGNITISGNVYYLTGILTYVSGTLTVTGSTLNIVSSCTLNTSGMSWNNVTISGGTTTLTSNCTATGNLTITAASTINGLFNLNVGGNLTINNTLNSGTATIVLNGTGTWSQLNSSINLINNVTIDTNGTITFNQTYLSVISKKFTYIKGNIISTGSTFDFQNSTLDVKGLPFNNVMLNGTITLNSDVEVNGFLCTYFNATVNGSYNINCYNGINLTAGLSSGNLLKGTGSPIINMYGGVITTTASYYIDFDTFIRGNVRISGTLYLNSSATRTHRYINGNVNCLRGSVLLIGTNNVFIDYDKINFRTISVASNVTMNKFFSGSALIPTRIQSSVAGTNRTITFQDNFEKITKFTKISNCTISRRGQLLSITNNSNKGGNVGVRYINQLPNGVPKNAPTVAAAMAYSVANISDPNFIIG